MNLCMWKAENVRSLNVPRDEKKYTHFYADIMFKNISIYQLTK